MNARGILLYALCAVVILVSAAIALSLVTYDPTDLSSEYYTPEHTQVRNWAGPVGAHTAHFLYEWLGFVAVLPVALVIYWSAVTAVSGRFEKKAVRFIGAVIFIASVSAFAESLPISPRWLAGPGGVLGKFFSSLLVPVLGILSFGVLFGCLSFLSLCLATDARLASFVLAGARRALTRAGGLIRGMPPARPPEYAVSSPQKPEEEVSPAEEEPQETPQEQTPVEPAQENEEKPDRHLGRRRTAAPTGEYRLPGPSLLTKPEAAASQDSATALREESNVLCKTLAQFGIGAEVVNIEVGPVVIQYQLELAAGTKVHKVMALSDDLAMALKTPSVRIVAPIPGKSAVGIEVPNKKRVLVRLRELFETQDFDPKRYEIPLFLGKDCSGNSIFMDLTDMPHLLIAGATGSGKTVCLNSIIMGMLMTRYPNDLKLLLVDPKMVEMASFKGIPHLMSPVVTNMKRAPSVLDWAATKMDERYDLLAEARVRSLVEYNALGEKEIAKRTDRELPGYLPYIVIIIDELADLMSVAAKEVETSITRLAQKSRAVGIHIILATQRPSVDVITGLIKSNLPARISFRVTSKIDSRTILDRNGAEKLLGQGDLLMLPPGSTDMIRAQGTYVSDAEVRAVVEFIKAQAEPEYYEDLADWDSEREEIEAARDDPLYNDAIGVIVETQRGSASLLQRRLGIGYTRASRFVDMMEEDGIVGDHREAQARKVLLTPEEWEQKKQDRPAP